MIEHLLYLINLRKESTYDIIRGKCIIGKAMVKGATRVITFSSRQQSFMFSIGLPQAKVLSIPQGLTDEAMKQCLLNRNKTRTGCLKIGYVGRLVYVKGVHLLVDAIHRIPKEVPLELHIIGKIDQSDYVKGLLIKAQNDSRIIFHDVMPNDKLLKEYGKFDLVCIPSLCFETGPYTLLESMYSGCLTLCSKNIGQLGFSKRFGGMVVNENTASEWSDVISYHAQNLQRLRNKIMAKEQISEIRTFKNVSQPLLSALELDKKKI